MAEPVAGGPYFIEANGQACERCGQGETWDIIDPDGAALGTSYGDHEHAEEIAELMNDAYHRGLTAAASKPKEE